MSDPVTGRGFLSWGAVVFLLIAPTTFAGVSLSVSVHPVGVVAPYYPTARSGAAMVYDPVDRYVVLFGGSNGDNDTWTFSGGRWTELSETTAPTARVGACAAWDVAGGYLVLFGGQLTTPNRPLANDTWEFVHGRWSELHPLLSPPPLAWTGCTYDAALGVIVMFGGTSPENETTGATWTFASGQWTLEPVHESPRPISPRFGSAMLYWAPGAYVDMYGGQGNTSSLADSWSWISGGWQEINSGHAPAGRVLASVAVNISDQVGVLFGGAVSFNGSTSDSTWTLGASGRWTRAPTVSGPSTRFEAAFAYDALDQYFVLFGGSGSTTSLSPPMNDTWTYSGVNWTNISVSADRPPPPVTVSSGQGALLFEYLGAAIAIAVVALVVLIVFFRRRRLRGSSTSPPASPDSGVSH